MDPRFLIFLTCVVAVFYFLLLRPNLTVRTQLQKWADKNRLTIASAERRYMSQGPFTWKYRSGCVYRIEVQTPQGITGQGWIRLAYDLFRREKWSAIVTWDDPALMDAYLDAITPEQRESNRRNTRGQAVVWLGIIIAYVVGRQTGSIVVGLSIALISIGCGVYVAKRS